MIGWKPKSSDTRVASARIRCLNPLRELQRRGYPAELFRADRAGHYSAVVYSKLYDEATYREALALHARGVRVVVDLCDNYLHVPQGIPELAQARMSLERMLRLADYIVASTPELATVIRAELGPEPSVAVIGDAVEPEIVGVRESAFGGWLHRRKLHRLLRWLASGQKKGIGSAVAWFGIHGGPYHEHGMSDLLLIRPLLENLHERYGIQLTVISNSKERFTRTVAPWRLPTHYLEWSPGTFQAALRAHQIAVIPVAKNPFTWCKSNNRLATALSAGVSVVADGIPSYQEFARVCRLDNWEQGLTEYIRDPVARRRDVGEGQALVARLCSPQAIADAWQELFDSVSIGPGTRNQLETSRG
jgi:hypothetical protein